MDPDSRCPKLYPYIFSSHLFIAVTMKTIANEAFQKRVISYFKKVAKMSKLKTVQNFASEGKHRFTIYIIIGRYQATKKTNYTRNASRPATVATPRLWNRVLKTFKQNPFMSVAVAARKISYIPKTSQHIKAKKLGFKSYRMHIRPQYINSQEQRAKMGLRNFYKKKEL